MKDLKKVCVIGVGMTKFHKPGQMDYPELSKEAGEAALKDAGVSYAEVEQAFVGYVYGDSTCGQRAVYQLGLTGIPVYNVNNNCSTGSTALYMGWQAIAKFSRELHMEDAVVEACRRNLLVWELYLNGIAAGGDALNQP